MRRFPCADESEPEIMVNPSIPTVIKEKNPALQDGISLTELKDLSIDIGLNFYFTL
jgi:hypothetical protein